MKLVRRTVLALLLFATAGCRGDRVFTEMTDSTFVQTMVALRKLPVGENIDSISRNQARDSILQAHGVTAAQVESTAVRLANDPARASDIWRAIENPNPTRPIPQKKNGA